MRHYKHLTLFERENLLLLRAKGYSITAIAEKLGRNKGTISRELRRNTSKGEYMPVTAQQQYQKRRIACRPRKSVPDMPSVYQFAHWHALQSATHKHSLSSAGSRDTGSTF